MKISCVIVSYNNGELLRKAIMSVVGQTRPADEIIVADDASTDGSRRLIEALSHNHAPIKPIFRERNLGVSANRDLAMREARGDYVTFLDGDDYFLPTKIEAEARALHHTEGIAYSDLRLVDRSNNEVRAAAIAEFARFGASDRIRWILTRAGWSPAVMLIPKEVHLRIGGYNHSLRTYEDWDYILRLAAQPLRWVHSGGEGPVLHVGVGGGLSAQRNMAHLRDELKVLRLNHEIVRRHAGLSVLLATAGKAVAMRSRWGILWWYLGKRQRWRKRRGQDDATAP